MAKAVVLELSEVLTPLAAKRLQNAEKKALSRARRRRMVAPTQGSGLDRSFYKEVVKSECNWANSYFGRSGGMDGLDPYTRYLQIKRAVEASLGIKASDKASKAKALEVLGRRVEREIKEESAHRVTDPVSTCSTCETHAVVFPNGYSYVEYNVIDI